jgi:hypothetical protein
VSRKDEGGTDGHFGTVSARFDPLHRLKVIRPAAQLHRAQISDSRVPSFRIVETFNVIEHVGLGVSLVRYISRAVRSIFNDDKKLSIAELSQTLLIEQTTP